MKIQNLNNNNQHFGLRISQNAQAAIIDQYKKSEASDNEVIYYLMKLKTSQPDKFELQHIKFDEQVKNNIPGRHKLALETEMWVSDGKKSGKFIIPRTYDYEDAFSNAETKLFYFEHLSRAINKAVAKMQYGKFKPSPLQEYASLIKKSDFD